MSDSDIINSTVIYIYSTINSKVHKTFKDYKLHLSGVGKCSQEQLLEILPLLYQDLLAGNPNTLEEFKVEYKHVIVEDLTNQIQKDAISICVLMLLLG